MQDRQPRAVALLERSRQGGDQRDLRHQQDRAAPALEGRGHAAQVDLGLAAAGHAAQQVAVARPLPHCGDDRVGREPLVGPQPDRGAGCRREDVAVELEPLDLAERTQNSLGGEAAHDALAAADRGAHLVHGRRPAEARQQIDHRAARSRAAAALFELLDLARRELDRGAVAAAPPLGGREPRPAVGDQPADDLFEIVQPRSALQVGELGAAERAERVDHARLVRGSGHRERPGIGEPDPLVAPGRIGRRADGAQHLAERRQVVVGDPAGEVEQLGREQRGTVDDLVDRPHLDTLGSRGGESHDHPGEPPLAHSNPRAAADLGLAGEGRRHAVGERAR